MAARFFGIGLLPPACWDCGFESHRGHGHLSVVSVVCCQVDVSATSWSLVQRSPIDCGASLIDNRNLKNEEAIARVGPHHHRKKSPKMREDILNQCRTCKLLRKASVPWSYLITFIRYCFFCLASGTETPKAKCLKALSRYATGKSSYKIPREYQIWFCYWRYT